MAKAPLKPYQRSTRPKQIITNPDLYPDYQYLDEELKKIQVSIKLLTDAVKQIQDYIGSPPL